WSSDVCSSDLDLVHRRAEQAPAEALQEGLLHAIGHEPHLVAVKRLQLRYHVAKPVGQPLIDGRLADPDISREEVAGGEPSAAPAAHLCLERLVDGIENRHETRHVFSLLGPERVEKALGPAGGVDAALDPVAGEELREAEAGREDRKSTRLNSSHVKISY